MATADGVELNVLVAGSGPDVLLIHGFPDDHGVWREQIGALVAAGYRVIAPDTRGCGDSTIPTEQSAYRLEHLVADLITVMDRLGVARAAVVGHDWGAVQAWHVAMRHPDRVARLIALSVGHPAAYARAGWQQMIRGYYVWLIQLRGLVEWLVQRRDWLALRRMSGFASEVPRWRARLERPGRLTAAFRYYRANLRSFLRAPPTPVEVPVAGIWSSGDRFLIERQMQASRQYCVRGWRYARLDGCNHWLQLTAPAECNRLLLDCLAEDGQRS